MRRKNLAVPKIKFFESQLVTTHDSALIPTLASDHQVYTRCLLWRQVALACPLHWGHSIIEVWTFGYGQCSIWDLKQQWLNNIYWTRSRFLQFTLLPCGFFNSQVKDYGPLPISTYMRHCLSYPVHGFYMNPESVVFGSRRDLTTSPDIRQIFGEVWPGAVLESKIER